VIYIPSLTTPGTYDTHNITTKLSEVGGTTTYWPPIQARMVPVVTSLTGATYNPYTKVWYLVTSTDLYRLNSLPNLVNPPTTYPSIPLNGFLTSSTGIAIADDGRAYVSIQESGSGFKGVRAFGLGSSLGFDFSIVKNYWNVTSTTSSNELNGIIPLAGFGAIAIFNDADGDAMTDLQAFNIGTTNSSFGVSKIPGTLFSKYDVYGTPITSPLGTPLLSNPGDGMESTTDGSGFIICTKAAAGNCYLFSQTCKTDADCVSGAACQKTYVDQAGHTQNYFVPFCASLGKARDDFGTTARHIALPISVLTNDTRSTGTCRDSTFELKTVSTTLYDGLATIETSTLKCGGSAPCILYESPLDGTCNIIDSFTYSVNLGGGQTGTATVRVTVTCDCGNGKLDVGEECDATIPGSAPNCDSACHIIASCGDSIREGAEACDDGRNCTDGTACTSNITCSGKGDGQCITRSGDGCSWDCRVEGCGNGVLDASEECDVSLSPTTCRADCTLMECGDGIVDPIEECDDKNFVETDGCLSTCKKGPKCGNGILEGAEVCDDGDGINTNACRNNCTPPFCGDSTVDPGEECDDGGNLDDKDCSWNCLQPECGNGRVDYNEQCDDGNKTPGDGCNESCMSEGFCGNSVKEGAEACDDGPSGSATCRSNCTVPKCGDRIVDTGETCDDGNVTSSDGCDSLCHIEGYCGDGTVNGSEVCDFAKTPLTCNSQCQLIQCGNGFIEFGEDCDDQNTNNADGCRSDCKIPRCGDGTIDPSRGEECDEGSNNGSSTCTSFCLRPAYCGNGKVDFGEQCDDGGNVSGDGCSATCLFEGCGNGILEANAEECDPTAPRTPDEPCRSNCTLIRCGDSYFDTGEQCDDGNVRSSDGCSSECLLETVCGDNVRVPDVEQCDDGNSANGDGCSSICRWEYCGNGVRDQNASGAYVEACDDGNNVNGDGCSSTCTTEPVCGDNTRQGAEQCDDGNRISGDGCSSDCRLEAYCGDGKVDPGEECDYNAPNTTGCTLNCTKEIIIQ
jgi:cysteine-rich repeat protein